MEQLDKWNKEMRRLSVAKFAETDDALYNYYKEALKSLKVEVKQYVENYDQLSFSKRLEVDNRLKTANRIDGILNDLNSWSDAEIRRYIEQNIALPDLGPDHLCKAFGLSRASLGRRPNWWRNAREKAEISAKPQA